MKKELDTKLKPTMLDPSILCLVDFWKEATDLQEIFPTIYFPESIKQMKNAEFQEFFGGYLIRENILSVDEVIKRSGKSFKSFSWQEYSAEIPEQFRVGFDSLRRGLEQSYIAKSIQSSLMDEFVFLTIQSSVLSRMKKIFKVFEKFDAIPLLNLEKKAPEEWKKSIRGTKKACKCINWVASIVGFSLFFGPVVGPIVGYTVTGVRLLIVDPSNRGNHLEF